MKKTASGFTIVELLIVIVVIAIIATLTIVAYSGIQSRAQAAAAQSALEQTAKKLALYAVDNSNYPVDLPTIGLTGANGTSFQYSVDNTATPPTYCVTASNGTTAYMISSTNTIPQSGVCSGHTDPGGSGGAIVANGGVVTTLAGSASAGSANGTGAAASFYYPYGITVDSAGTLYVADTYNHRIRKITPAGVVTTLAGSGSGGFADGTGAAAVFNYPESITIDSTGTLYVADFLNNRIRKITPAGVVTTLAGSGAASFADGTGAAAAFNRPTGVAVSSGGIVYVADTSNNRIRQITAAGVVTTLAGSGGQAFADGTGAAAGFNQSRGIIVDSTGILYVADTSNNRIRQITAAGVVTTLAGSGGQAFADGTGTAAVFNQPQGITVDSAGTLYVADTYNHRIRQITPAGVVTTLAGSGSGSFANGTGTVAAFYQPMGITVDSGGAVYVADTYNQRIRAIR